MIEAKGIRKSYGNLVVLQGVDLSVKSGEIVSIVGASGAGKSTLLHIIGTLDPADSGSLMINGEDPYKLSSKKLSEFRNKYIGFVFQFHHLLPEFSALENVCIPGFIAKRSKKEVEKKAKELLDYLGMSNRLSHKPNQLSGGEQQRVAVARSLINDPAIVLADEPSGNLDSTHAHELHELFFRLKKEVGQTFLIVTHNESFAALADRKLEIIDGKIDSIN